MPGPTTTRAGFSRGASPPQPSAQWRPAPQCLDLWLMHWTPSRLAQSFASTRRAMLSPWQLDRMERIDDPVSRARYGWTQTTVLEILRRYACEGTTLQMDRDTHGKPFLAGGVPSFSLSHTGAYAVLVVDPRGQALGVDLERCDGARKMGQVVSRFFSKAQQERFRRMDPTAQSRAFYWWWTAKEALGKAQGRGLSTELLGTAIPEGQGRVRWKGSWWELWDLGSWEGAQGALCRLAGDEPRPALRTFWMNEPELA